MYRWGYIKCFRFDNGRPFGDPKRETLSPAALYLVAIGCSVLFNPPRTPTRNAKVERCQGTTSKWADAANSANIDEFRKNLEYAVIAQRERLKSRVCKGKTRMEYYPSLKYNIRKFNAQDFDKQRVFKFLMKGQWYRKVNKVGQVSLFAKIYQVGFSFRNQEVTCKVSLEQNRLMWNFFDAKQQLIKQLLAQNLDDTSYFSF